MNNHPLISVIVPVYNVEKYLRKCLDSICGQTYRNLEILCVNDGSTDGSAAILEEYADRDKRIKVFRQKNAGLSAARNTALEVATGEWIAGVDSDDYLESDAFEYALAEADDQTDIITYGVQVTWQDVPDDPRMQQYFDIHFKGKHAASVDLISQSPVTFWDKLWRKSLIDRFNCRFPVGLWYEDTYFYYALAPFARKISYRPDKKYHYVRRGGSIMSESTSSNPKLFDRLRIALATLDFYKENPLPENFQKMKLIAFSTNFFSSLELISQDCMKAYLDMAREVALQHDLLKEYPQQLRFLNKVPWWLRPFVRHKISKSYYGLPGLPIVTIIRHKDKQIIRILGIKIH